MPKKRLPLKQPPLHPNQVYCSVANNIANALEQVFMGYEAQLRNHPSAANGALYKTLHLRSRQITSALNKDISHITAEFFDRDLTK